MFPEESESWHGIDHSLFPLSHTQAHRCSLCCASFTDRHTSIRGELGQRVQAAVCMCQHMNKYVFGLFIRQKEKKKARDGKNRFVRKCVCIRVCFFHQWKLDHISFSSCIMTAWAGNRNNRYCICVCAAGRLRIVALCQFWQCRGWLQRTAKSEIRDTTLCIRLGPSEKTDRGIQSEWKRPQDQRHPAKVWPCRVRLGRSAHGVWMRRWMAGSSLTEAGVMPYCARLNPQGGTVARVVLRFPGTRQTRKHAIIYSHITHLQISLMQANTHSCLLM